jgi:hypothetical protein
MKHMLFVLLIIAAVSVYAQEEDNQAGAEFFGYAEQELAVRWHDDGSVQAGASIDARLKGLWSPNDRLEFIVELDVRGAYGASNPYALYASYGIPITLPEDAHWSADFDHIYGKINMGPLDISIGKQPIAWGSGYAFNPTSRTYSTSLLDSSPEETPGVLAAAASLALSRFLYLSGYLAGQDRSANTAADPAESHPENLPFGAKITGVLGSFDLSASFLRETALRGAGYERRAYAGFDFSGAVGMLGVHGEAALGLPAAAAWGTGPSDFRLERDLELCTGFDFTFLGGVETRLEYYYNGSGAGDTEGYEPAALLDGSALVLGRQYGFVYLERIFADYFTVSIASLANIADGSVLLLPELFWDVMPDFSITMRAVIPLGSGGSEFGGLYPYSAFGLPYPGSMDVMRPGASVAVRLQF